MKSNTSDFRFKFSSDSMRESRSQNDPTATPPAHVSPLAPFPSPASNAGRAIVVRVRQNPPSHPASRLHTGQIGPSLRARVSKLKAVAGRRQNHPTLSHVCPPHPTNRPTHQLGLTDSFRRRCAEFGGCFGCARLDVYTRPTPPQIIGVITPAHPLFWAAIPTPRIGQPWAICPLARLWIVRDLKARQRRTGHRLPQLSSNTHGLWLNLLEYHHRHGSVHPCGEDRRGRPCRPMLDCSLIPCLERPSFGPQVFVLLPRLLPATRF